MRVAVELLVDAQRELPFSRVQVERHIEAIVSDTASTLRTSMISGVQERFRKRFSLRARIHTRRTISPVILTARPAQLFPLRSRSHCLLWCVDARKPLWRKRPTVFNGCQSIVHPTRSPLILRKVTQILH